MNQYAVVLMGQLHGSTEYIIFSVTAVATIIFWVVWIVLQRAKVSNERGIGAVNEENYSAGKELPGRRQIRSIVIASYLLFAVGTVLILAGLGRLKSHPTTLYVGVAIVIVGWAGKTFAEVEWLAAWRRRSMRNRAKPN